MSASAQRWCVYSGYGLMVLFFTGFGAVSHFLIAPSPMASAAEIASMFAERRNEIRVGLLITMFAAALLVPWSAAMFVQLRRGEGPFSPLPHVQMLCGALFSLEFMYMIMFWQTAAFREDTAPELIRLLNDMAWIPFVGLTSTAVVMAAALGFSILGNDPKKPVYPRWAGYFNLWVALLFTPGSLCVFFKQGPFAYNGLIAWYLPVAVFTIWIPVNCVLTLRAIREQERAAGEVRVGVSGAISVESLAEELAQLRRELAQGSAR